MIYCETIDYLPHIPQDMISSLTDIEKRVNVFPDPMAVETYASYEIEQELQEWAQSQFDYPVVARYQVIKKNLPIHRDLGIKGTKYNFLITTGGNNVITKWWDDEKNPTTVLYEMIAKPLVWYNLNIETPHEVINVTEPRISITIRNGKR